MILDLSITPDKEGKINATPSVYRPGKEDKARITQMLADFQTSNTAKNKKYREFDNMTLLDRQSVDQYRFNSYQFMENTLPGEEWKSNAVRPITRNRVISIAAHITGALMYPQIHAWDYNDAEDQDAATVMRDLMEWSNQEAKYEQTFTYAAIAMLVNPAVIIHTEYAEVYRTVRREDDEGKQYEEDIIDTEYSGFQDTIVPLDEIWFPNFYQQNIQRQPHIIWRKVVMWNELEVKYAQNEKFTKYCRKGVQTMAGPDGNSFYDQSDPDLNGECGEEIIYWNRNLDLRLVFVNGILISESSAMNPREDKKLPFVKGGFELFDEGKFAFYKSQVNKLGPDEEAVQTLYRMVMDGTFLQLMPPVVVMGDETINSAIISPGTVTTLKETSKVQPINVGNNIQAGMNMLSKVEQSVTESSVDPGMAGLNTPGTQTAYQVNRNEQNAKIMLGLFGRMIGFMIRDFADLRISDILQYLTIGEASELTDGMKFRSFILPDKVVEGTKKSKKISFNMDMPNEKITKGELLKRSFALREEEVHKFDDKTQLVHVNPDLFRKRKFMTKVTPEILHPLSDDSRRSMNLEEYDRAINNPLADQEAIFRDLLLGSYETTKNEPEKYMKKADAAPPMDASMMGEPGPASGLPKLLLNQRQQKTQSQLMSKPLAAYGKR